MSRERGFRRLALGASLVLLCAGLALTAHDIYPILEYRNTLTEEEDCRRWHGSDQKKAMAECSDIYREKRGNPLPSRVSLALDTLLTIGEATLSHDTLFAVFSAIFHRLLAFTVCLGLAVSLILATIPWAVFYFARWIARGFG